MGRCAGLNRSASGRMIGKSAQSIPWIPWNRKGSHHTASLAGFARKQASEPFASAASTMTR